MCACVSTNPGSKVFPLQSISLAPAGTLKLPLFPTATMRLFTISTSPLSITSLPFIVMMRPFFNNTTPLGLSFGKNTFTCTSVGVYLGSFGVVFAVVSDLAFSLAIESTAARAVLSIASSARRLSALRNSMAFLAD